MKVLISLFSSNPFLKIQDKFVHRLKNDFPTVIFFTTSNKDELLRELKDADVWITYKAKSGWIKDIKKLKWVHFAGSGSENLIPRELLESEIILTCSRGINSEQVCEHALCLMLALSKKLNLWINAKKEGDINILSEDNVPLQLSGKVAGLFGLGCVGEKVARTLKSFNMEVIATRIELLPPKPGVKVDKVYAYEEYEKVLENSDYVIICLPLTTATIKMFGINEFKKMKSTAFLINVSRGEIIQENELIYALENNLIAGAGLDVFEREPLDKSSELYKLDNVILTPHIAGYQVDYWSRLYELVHKNIKDFLSGEKPRYEINRGLGY